MPLYDTSIRIQRPETSGFLWRYDLTDQPANAPSNLDAGSMTVIATGSIRDPIRVRVSNITDLFFGVDVAGRYPRDYFKLVDESGNAVASYGLNVMFVAADELNKITANFTVSQAPTTVGNNLIRVQVSYNSETLSDPFNSSLLLNPLSSEWSVGVEREDIDEEIDISAWGYFESDSTAIIVDAVESDFVQTATMIVRYDNRIRPTYLATIDGVTYRIQTIDRIDRRRNLRLGLSTEGI